jgi:flagellar protein FliS
MMQRPALRNGAAVYADVGLRTSVESSSPLGLVLMLYDGAIESLVRARAHMIAGNVAGKAKTIHKAVEIINNGLNASLDPVAGGELALNLKSLNEYMAQQLLLASLKNDTALLDHVRSLLVQLRGAWNSIADQPAAAVRPGPSLASRSVTA